MAENNAPETALQRISNLKVALNDDFVQSQLRSTLSDNAAGFAASIIELYSGDSYLQGCDPKQVIMQALKAAALKLPINKSIGFAWIIAYQSKAGLAPQFQIGYKGLIQLALRTGQYRIIHAGEVYEGEYQSANKLTGEFDLNGIAKSDKVIGYFAHFELLNGFSKTLFMTVDKVTAHAQKYSKSFNQQYSPWKTEFPKMAKKTVLRLLLSGWGYLSVEMANAMETDSNGDVAEQVLNEVRTQANRKDMGFPEAEVVGDAGNGAAKSPF